MRTVVGVAVLPGALLLGSMVALPLSLLRVPTGRLHWIFRACAWFCLRVGGTRLYVEGADHLAGGPYVVVSNHESMWDAPCVVAGLSRLVLRFVAKQSVMRIPVFGHALRLTGNVSVVRTETEEDVRRLRRAMQDRARQVSVLFFAEGTRSRDGALHPFKMGPFATALASGLPVLPVGLAGTLAVLPPDKLRLRRGPAALVIGEPVPTEGLDIGDRVRLRDDVHCIVSHLRGRARALVRAHGGDPGGVD